MNKPNILIALATDILGGPGKGLEQFLRYGALEACNPLVIDYIINNDESETDFVRTIKDTGVPMAKLFQNNPFDLAMVDQAIELIQKNNIQVLQSHGYKSHMLCYLLHRKTKLPWISVVEGWTSENFKIHCYNALEHMLIHGATEIVAVSESLRSRLLPFAKKRCLVIPNAIAPENLQVTITKEEMKKKLNISDDTLIIGTLGRLSPEKNLTLFLKAFAEIVKQHPNLHALIVGDGQEREALKTSAKDLNIENKCSFIGHITDVANYYNLLDIQVMPSLTEGMPYSALEGMCMEIPLVASDAGGIPEVVKHGVTGLLFPSENLSAFVESLLTLVQSKQTRLKLGQAGKERIEQHFTPQVRTQQFIDLYDKVLSKESVRI